MQMKNHYVLEC